VVHDVAVQYQCTNVVHDVAVQYGAVQQWCGATLAVCGCEGVARCLNRMWYYYNSMHHKHISNMTIKAKGF
jgi:hypothetical protein